MRTVPIEKLSIRSLRAGTPHRLWIEVLSTLAGPVTVPALAVKGIGDGPTLIAVAGVHGDEYEGMEAIRRVFDELDPAGMRGTFLGLPVVNPFAYEARDRVGPLHVDGLNLARVFPGDPVGSPTRLLAHRLLQFVLENLTADDLFLDFHSGSADVQFASLIGFRDIPGLARDRSEEAARHFGFSRLWRIPDSQGPFNAETARRGITTLGTETTGRAGCDPDDVSRFVQGLINLLAYLGILRDASRPERYDGPPRPTADVVAPATGFLRASRTLHDEVAVGDRLATIISLFGDLVAEIRAPISGTIWAARSMPPVRLGELTYMIAERNPSVRHKGRDR